MLRAREMISFLHSGCAQCICLAQDSFLTSASTRTPDPGGAEQSQFGQNARMLFTGVERATFWHGRGLTDGKRAFRRQSCAPNSVIAALATRPSACLPFSTDIFPKADIWHCIPCRVRGNLGWISSPHFLYHNLP